MKTTGRRKTTTPNQLNPDCCENGSFQLVVQDPCGEAPSRRRQLTGGEEQEQEGERSEGDQPHAVGEPRSKVASGQGTACHDESAKGVGGAEGA
jgi:hypothetical protein